MDEGGAGAVYGSYAGGYWEYEVEGGGELLNGV